MEMKQMGQVCTVDGVLIYNLIFYGLPLEITEKEVLDYFEKFGKVLELRLVGRYNGGYGYVNFADPKVAAKVLQTSKPKPFFVKERQSWHQPYCKNIVSIIENVKNGTGTIDHEDEPTVKKALILKLKYCCFEHILSELPLCDQINFALTCQDFLRIFLKFSKLKYKEFCIRKLSMLNTWQTRIFLQVVGPQIKNLSGVRLTFFKPELIKPFLLYCTNIKKIEISLTSLPPYSEHLKTEINVSNSIELSELSLPYNDFLIPASFCQYLKFLKISDTLFTGIYITGLHNLEGLSLYKCTRLESKYFKQICQSINLRYLDIRWCTGLKKDDFEEILNNLRLLETLKFTANASQDYSCIAQLPELKRLEIDDCDSNSKGLQDFLIKLSKYQAEQLEELMLWTPNCLNLKKVGELRKLKVLLIYKNAYLNYSCLKKISLLTELQEVVFEECRNVTDMGLLHLLKYCHKLGCVGLWNCGALTFNFVIGAIKLLRERRAKFQSSNIIHIVVGGEDMCFIREHISILKDVFDVLKIKAIFDRHDFYRECPRRSYFIDEEDDFTDED